ncbi:phytoene desaturase family protein [Pirellulaceae bacterium SH449]
MQDNVKFKPHYDVAIVGGGHNGLVAANYLALAGLDVIVLEQKSHLGGASVSAKIFPDYDALVSRYAYLISLFPTEILSELKIDFQTCRRRTASFTPYVEQNGTPSGLLLSNVDPELSRQSFLAWTGNENAWTRYQQLLELESSIAKLVWPTMTQPLKSRESFLGQLQSDADRQAWDWFVERPLGQAIEHFIDDDLVRGLVMTDAKIGVFTHPHDESLIQNRCFLYHVIGRGTGEWQVPIGGMGGLVAGLSKAALARGATVVTDAEVIAVGLGNDTHSVQIVYGPSGSSQQTVTFDATRVVFNASPKRTARILNQSWQPTTTDEGSVVKVNMLLQRLPKLRCKEMSSTDAFAGSLHINEGYQQMIGSYEIAKSGRVPKPAPCEIYCHTLTDPTILSADLQQRGFHTMTLFGLDAPYRLFEKDNHEAVRAEFLQSYLDGLNDFCGESFEDCLAKDSHGNPCIEVKSALDLETEVGLDMGNIFHNSLSWFFASDRHAIGSWGVETEQDRVYICGSSAMRGGAVSGIPGHNAAKKIFEELGINQ